MPSWAIIEDCLAHRWAKPKKQAWLAAKLGVSVASITNWKIRGEVPDGRIGELSEIFELPMEQIAGKAPLPWTQKAAGGWPFPGIERERFDRLTEAQRIEIQGAVRHLIEKFEAEKASLGKSSNSQGGAYRNKAA